MGRISEVYGGVQRRWEGERSFGSLQFEWSRAAAMEGNGSSSSSGKWLGKALGVRGRRWSGRASSGLATYSRGERHGLGCRCSRPATLWRHAAITGRAQEGDVGGNG